MWFVQAMRRRDLRWDLHWDQLIYVHQLKSDADWHVASQALQGRQYLHNARGVNRFSAKSKNTVAVAGGAGGANGMNASGAIGNARDVNLVNNVNSGVEWSQPLSMKMPYSNQPSP
jgi:hypothetical protein